MSVGLVPNSKIWLHTMQLQICLLSRSSFCHYKQFLMILYSFFAQNLQVRCLQKHIDKLLLSSYYLFLGSRNGVNSIYFCVFHRLLVMSSFRISGLYTSSSSLKASHKIFKKKLINYLNLVLDGSLGGPVYLRNMSSWLFLSRKESWSFFIHISGCQTI